MKSSTPSTRNHSLPEREAPSSPVNHTMVVSRFEDSSDDDDNSEFCCEGSLDEAHRSDSLSTLPRTPPRISPQLHSPAETFPTRNPNFRAGNEIGSPLVGNKADTTAGFASPFLPHQSSASIRESVGNTGTLPSHQLLLTSPAETKKRRLLPQEPPPPPPLLALPPPLRSRSIHRKRIIRDSSDASSSSNSSSSSSSNNNDPAPWYETLLQQQQELLQQQRELLQQQREHLQRLKLRHELLEKQLKLRHELREQQQQLRRKPEIAPLSWIAPNHPRQHHHGTNGDGLGELHEPSPRRRAGGIFPESYAYQRRWQSTMAVTIPLHQPTRTDFPLPSLETTEHHGMAAGNTPLHQPTRTDFPLPSLETTEHHGMATGNENSMGGASPHQWPALDAFRRRWDWLSSNTPPHNLNDENSELDRTRFLKESFGRSIARTTAAANKRKQQQPPPCDARVSASIEIDLDSWSVSQPPANNFRNH